jgi:hypothetical protein
MFHCFIRLIILLALSMGTSLRISLVGFVGPLHGVMTPVRPTAPLTNAPLPTQILLFLEIYQDQRRPLRDTALRAKSHWWHPSLRSAA